MNKLSHYSMGFPSMPGSLSVTAELLKHFTCIFMPSRPSLWEERKHSAAAQTQRECQEADWEPWCAHTTGTRALCCARWPTLSPYQR